MKPTEQIEREDLVMFINACLSCTGQGEFYDDYSYSYGQKISLDFLHDYILGNYRRLYCLTLAAGINHFNQAQIVIKLLASGNTILPAARAIENQLITTTLDRLPPQRAWGLLLQLRKRGINNRRARSLAQAYINSRGDKLAFQAVKYRAKLRAIVAHFHLKLEPELSNFLFGRWQHSFTTEIFEQFRQARQSEVRSWLEQSTIATLRQTPLKLGKVAAVLDRSYSSSGAREKRRRPLGIALAVDALLRTAAQSYQAFWTVPTTNPLLVTPRGQTNLATPLLYALDRHQWHLETTATALRETLPDLVRRIEKANLGYLINNEIREQSRKARR